LQLFDLLVAEDFVLVQLFVRFLEQFVVFILRLRELRKLLSFGFVHLTIEPNSRIDKEIEGFLFHKTHP